MKKKLTVKTTLYEIKRWLPLYVMMLPAFIYLFINNYLPMAGIIVAFKKYNAKLGLFKSEWIGLKNFNFLITSADFPIIVRNTVLYNVAFIFLNVVLGVFLALLLTEVRSKNAKKLFQTSVLLPYVMSSIIVAYMVFAFLDANAGMVTHLLAKIGIKDINFYAETKYWPFILTFVHCWKGTGYGCLMYVSAIVGIDPSLFEAASLDGASKFQKIRHITLPLIKPTIITLTLLAIGKIFNSDFGLFYQVPRQSGVLYSVTQTIDVYVYNAMLSNASLGMSAAAGFFQSVVGFVLIMIFNSITRKLSRDNAIF